MANSVNPDERARYSLRSVSSGSALFAKVSVLVCKDERIKRLFLLAIMILQLFSSL